MYCKIIENQIVQCSIHPEPNFVWVENGVCGMIQNLDGTFSNPVLTQDQLLDIVRIQRNMLLGETDWWVLPDRTPTQAQLDYRQALRDLPNNSPNAALDEQGNLINVTWPEMPQ